MITYTDEVWAEIRQRYESGETAGQIAKTPNYPSKQRINIVAKKNDWTRVPLGVPGKFPVITSETFFSIPDDLDPRKKLVLIALNLGANYKDAAIAAGASEDTLLRWRKQDAAFTDLCLRAKTGNKLEMLQIVKREAQNNPKLATWMLERHPDSSDEFGDRRQSTHIGTIRIGNIVPRSTPGVTLDQDEEPVAIEAKAVEVEPLVEPIPAQKKPVNRNGVEICPDCKQVPHPGYPHQCLSKRGLPI